jgi:hypothetical protein
MKLIAHRALTHGPNTELENTPHQIHTCLNMGLDVEIDVWFAQDCWWLGHDQATHKTTVDLLALHGLWIHAKNDEAAFELTKLLIKVPSINFFWHQDDHRTLTSQRFWWTYSGQSLCDHSVSVMPEWHMPLHQLKTWCDHQTCAAVCSDWISLIQPRNTH